MRKEERNDDRRNRNRRCDHHQRPLPDILHLKQRQTSGQSGFFNVGGQVYSGSSRAIGMPASAAPSMIRSLIDRPVNLSDTPRNCGFGCAEERIGAVIRQRGGFPEGFVVSTKLDRDIETGCVDSSQARRSFEEGIEGLSLDRVQISHLHDPGHAADPTEIIRPSGALDILFRIKEESLTHAMGLAIGRIDLLMSWAPRKEPCRCRNNPSFPACATR